MSRDRPRRHITFDGEHGLLYTLLDVAAGNTMGGDGTAGEGNTMTGLYGRGITLDGAGAGNVIAGNTIGLDASGALGEAPDVGIYVNDTPGTVVGANAGPGDLLGLHYERGNVVVGSTGGVGSGIRLDGTTTATIVAGNFVGIDQTERRRPLGTKSGSGSQRPETRLGRGTSWPGTTRTASRSLV